MILYLSRLCRDAETRYWPTELEIAGLVWTMTKIRYLVESAPKTVIYTDHGAALGIFKQKTLTSSSTVKTNLRLARVSEFLQRFRNVELRHKPGARHIVPDALSRLPVKDPKREGLDGQLDAWLGDGSHEEQLLDCAYTSYSNIEMSNDFKAKLIQGYQDDYRWRRIIEQLIANEELGENASTLPFEIDEELVYRVDKTISTFGTPHRRLCIQDPCVGDVFDAVHQIGHLGYGKCHDIHHSLILRQKPS